MKKVIVFFMMCSMLLCSCGKKADTQSELKAEDNQAVLKLEDNQRMVVGKISEIAGNDITVSLMEERAGGQRGDRPMPSGGEMPDGKDHPMPSGGEMPDGKDRPMPSGGEMPDGKDRPMPSGGEMPDGKDRPMPTGRDMADGELNSNDNSSSQSNEKRKQKSIYVETGETATYQVPVGTTVTTSQGTETTFSRLAADDTIKIVLEKDDSGNDVIVSIWIVG